MSGLAQAMGIPTGNLAEVVLNFAAPVTLIRFRPSATGKAAKGRANPPVPERSSISLSVQPLSQKELRQLPEGMRNQGRVKAYGVDELKTVDTSECRVPDRFIHKGITYQVDKVDDWEELGGYFRIEAKRVNR